MEIKTLNQVVELVKSKPKKRIVVASANDEHSIEAVNMAVDMGIVEATLVGDKDKIQAVCEKLALNPQKFTLIHEADENKAALLACDLINEGKGDILMKGLLSTDKYMRAILNKERGLTPPNAILTHITVVENPNKLIVVGDCAIILSPDLKQKMAILRHLINMANSVGVDNPKVALIAATEQMSANMPACVDAAIISKMADRGQIKGAVVDGPLSLDVALDKEITQIKGVNSPVAGEADCLLFPNIESANVFYKCCTVFNKYKMGAIVVGTKVPCVLSSRGDSPETKLYSIAIASSFN